MNKTPQLSKLESLNYDSRLAILGACDSFEDLAALIQASPTLFHTFLGNKAPLLLSVVGNILGPATRDAALLAKTLRNQSNDFCRQVDQVVHDYKAHLRVTRPPWVMGLDTETVVALTHITRHTQFCVDMFGEIQRQQFEHELIKLMAGAGVATLSGRPRLSRNERIRIAQAILRRQVLALVSLRSGFRQPVDWSRFMRELLPLFRTWEWQQISDADHFITFLLNWLDYNSEELKFTTISELEVIVQKLKNVLISYDAALRSIGPLWQFYICENDYRGDLDFLVGSHRFATPLLNDSQHPNTLGDDDDSNLESDIDDQPWAWRDALRGNATCRWGRDLVKAPRRDITKLQQYEKAKGALESWRSLGMVFWDREWCERLKQTRELEPCQTGWLIPWQD